MISLVTFLSYLPEAGQSTCFFVYLTLVLGFSKMNVAIYICYVGLVSAVSQTVVLSKMIERIGPKYSIMVGLMSQLVQLVSYGVTTNMVAVWVSGLAVALSSITYAAVSAYASLITDKDKQVGSWLTDREDGLLTDVPSRAPSRELSWESGVFAMVWARQPSVSCGISSG